MAKSNTFLTDLYPPNCLTGFGLVALALLNDILNRSTKELAQLVADEGMTIYIAQK